MPGLVAGLDALVVALGLLAAMLLVSAVLRPLLVAVLGRAPFIGGWLVANVDSGLADFQRAIIAPANASLGLVSSSLSWLAQQGRALTDGLGQVANAITTSIWTLATVTLPAALSATEQRLESLIEGARGYAVGLVQAAESDAQGLFNLAESDAQTLVSDARRDASDGIQAAEKVVLDEVRKFEQATGALWQQAEYDANQAVAGAEARVTGLVQGVEAEARAGVAAVERDLQSLAHAAGVLVSDTTAVLSGDIARARQELEQQISGVDELIKAEVAKVVQSGPWAAIVAAYEGGEAALAADVMNYVALGYQAIRRELDDAETIRQKYGPAVRAALAKVGKVK